MRPNTRHWVRVWSAWLEFGGLLCVRGSRPCGVCNDLLHASSTLAFTMVALIVHPCRLHCLAQLAHGVMVRGPHLIWVLVAVQEAEAEHQHQEGPGGAARDDHILLILVPQVAKVGPLVVEGLLDGVLDCVFFHHTVVEAKMGLLDQTDVHLTAIGAHLKHNTSLSCRQPSPNTSQTLTEISHLTTQQNNTSTASDQLSFTPLSQHKTSTLCHQP